MTGNVYVTHHAERVSPIEYRITTSFRGDGLAFDITEGASVRLTAVGWLAGSCKRHKGFETASKAAWYWWGEPHGLAVAVAEATAAA